MSAVQFWRMRRRTEQMSVDDFVQDEAELPDTLANGEVRVQSRFIALDPYLEPFSGGGDLPDGV